MPERCGPCSYHQFSVGTFHLDPLQGLEMVHIIIWGLAVIRRATAVSAMVDFGQFDPNLLGASNLNNSNDLNSRNQTLSAKYKAEDPLHSGKKKIKPHYISDSNLAIKPQIQATKKVGIQVRRGLQAIRSSDRTTNPGKKNTTKCRTDCAISLLVNTVLQSPLTTQEKAEVPYANSVGIEPATSFEKQPFFQDVNHLCNTQYYTLL